MNVKYKKETIEVKGLSIQVYIENFKNDYISLTDIAKEWREENPKLKENIRDYANLNELLVLANMKSYSTILIEKGIEQKERMIELRKLARTQLMSLENINNVDIKKLEKK
ncbi:hypothetical protein KST95_03825 [Fusobacterium nucleatum]